MRIARQSPRVQVSLQRFRMHLSRSEARNPISPEMERGAGPDDLTSCPMAPRCVKTDARCLVGTSAVNNCRYLWFPSWVVWTSAAMMLVWFRRILGRKIPQPLGPPIIWNASLRHFPYSDPGSVPSSYGVVALIALSVALGPTSDSAVWCPPIPARGPSGESRYFSQWCALERSSTSQLPPSRTLLPPELPGSRPAPSEAPPTW